MGKNTTKRSLLASVLALVMCVSMLVGTTFAWFTDTASTGVNKIQAGTLDIQLLDEDGNSLEGQTLGWKKAAGHENEEVLWEPGCTYELQPIVIKNAGNLALKYKIAISGIQGDAELNNAIEWTITNTSNTTALDADHALAAGASDTLTIKGHMKEDAGNEYQGLSIDGIAITVYATQYTSEYDSNNNTYDARAEYGTAVATAADFSSAIAAGKDVLLTSNIVLDSQLNITNDISIYGNGHTVISNKPVSVAADANVTIKNVNFAAPTNANNQASNLYSSGLQAKLVLDGCTFSGTQWDCIQITPVAGAEIVINNCTFELNTPAQSGNKTRFIHIEAAYGSNADVKITMTNNFFGASTYIREALIDIDYINLAGIDFGGNNIYTDTAADIYVCGASGVRTITAAEAYRRLGSLKPVVANTQTELNGAIASAQDNSSIPTEVVLPAGNFKLDNGTAQNKNITISGTSDTVVTVVGDTGYQMNYQNGATLAFEGVTIQGQTSGVYGGIAHVKETTFVNCTFNGKLTLYGDATFINCTFNNNSDYAIWTWGAKNAEFIGCTFNSGGKALLLYGGAGSTETPTTNLIVTNCTFNDNNTLTADKAAIEIGNDYNAVYNLTANNITVNGFAVNSAGISTGSTIWANKNSMDQAHLNVVINGVDVY